MKDEILPSRFRRLEWDERPDLQQGQGQAPVYDAEYFLREGERAFYRRDYETALLNYSRALRFDRDCENAWVGQVRALMETGELDEALVWCDRGLKRFGDSPLLLAIKGWIMGLLGDTEKGLGFVDSAFQVKSEDHPLLWLARAGVLFLEESPNARHCLEKAIEIGGARWQVLVDAGRLALRYGLAEVALLHAQKGLEKAADRPELWLLAGEVYQALGSDRQATSCFARARALDPRWEVPRQYLEAGRVGSRNWLVKILSFFGR